MNLEQASKTKKLGLSLLFDALGYLSFIIPVFDIIWAPAAGYLMTRLYKGRIGKIAGVITFIEEALPMLDIIPSFTLMWFYSYVFKTNEVIIEVDNN